MPLSRSGAIVRRIAEAAVIRSAAASLLREGSEEVEMADMVVSAATGVLSSLLSKLLELLADGYKQRKGARRDIEFLCSELTDMNAAPRS